MRIANLHVTVLSTGGGPFACSSAENGVSRSRWLRGERLHASARIVISYSKSLEVVAKL